MESDHAQQVAQAVSIVAAYVGNHHVAVTDLAGLLAQAHRAVIKLDEPPVDEAIIDKPTRKQIDASVGRDALISFIDGKPYKTLKRHLTKHGLSPESYRERYGLPHGYPMTSAGYSEKRSALAKSIGLGKPSRALHAVA